MNYLAHTYLVAENDEWIVGGILADLDDIPSNLSSGIKQGIEIHQKIDAFVESNLHFMELRSIFRPIARKYSGVIADMYCDRVLAERWSDFSDVLLDEFSNRVFQLLKKHIPPTSEQWSWMHKYITPSWLANYKNDAGMKLAFARLREKARYPESVPVFKQMHGLYSENTDKIHHSAYYLLSVLCLYVEEIKKNY